MYVSLLAHLLAIFRRSNRRNNATDTNGTHASGSLNPKRATSEAAQRTRDTRCRERETTIQVNDVRRWVMTSKSNLEAGGVPLSVNF